MSTQSTSERGDNFEFISQEVYSVQTGSSGSRLSIGTVTRLDARPGPEKWVVDAWCGVVDTGRYHSRGEAAMRLLKIHKEWFDRPDRSPITHRALSEQLRVIDGPGKRVVGLVRGRIVPLLGIGESVADVVALQFDCTELSEEKEELCC